ncbi:MAG: MFS transporter, partial [Bacteroidota bacterium]
IRENLEAGTKDAKKAPIGELFKPALRLVLLIGVVVAILQQITGINSVFFYAPMIFEQSGIGEDASFTQAIYVGLVNLVFTILAMSLIDRLGRKPLLAGGMIGITLFMFLLAYGFNSATYTLKKDALGVDISLLESLVNQGIETKESYQGVLKSALGEDYLFFEESLMAASVFSISNDSLINIPVGLSEAQLQPLLGREFTNDSTYQVALQEVLGNNYDTYEDSLENILTRTYLLREDSLTSLPVGIIPRGINLKSIAPLIGQSYTDKADYSNALKKALGFTFVVLEEKIMQATSTTLTLSRDALDNLSVDIDKTSLKNIVGETFTSEKDFTRSLQQVLDDQFAQHKDALLTATSRTYILKEGSLQKLPMDVKTDSMRTLLGITFEDDVSFKNALKVAYKGGLVDEVEQQYIMLEKKILAVATPQFTLTKAGLEGISEEIDMTPFEDLIGKSFANASELKAALKEAYDFDEALDAASGAAYTANESSLIASAITMDPMLILIGILGFVASFAISAGPVMWVLFSELFPNYIRGLAISFVGLINSAISSLVQLVFPWELANLGNATTFLIYGLFAAAGFIFVAWFVPETKGKSLEELEELLVASDKQRV